MASPIIDNIEAPTEVQPGASFQVTITAHDPDAGVLTLRAIAKDAAGHASPQLVSVTITDPLTFDLEDVDGAGLTITPTPGQLGTFDVVMPPTAA